MRDALDEVARAIAPAAADEAAEVLDDLSEQQLRAIAFYAVYCAGGLHPWESLAKLIVRATNIEHRIELAMARRPYVRGAQ